MIKLKEEKFIKNVNQFYHREDVYYKVFDTTDRSKIPPKKDVQIVKDSRKHYFRVYSDSEFIGYVSAHDHDKNTAMVHIALLRNGFGKSFKVAEKLEQLCLSRGKTDLLATVAKHNKLARALVEKRGGKLVQETDTYLLYHKKIKRN